ncbi:hypothetical protein AOLI_G00094880 [Acnodon oligacanthus]
MRNSSHYFTEETLFVLEGDSSCLYQMMAVCLLFLHKYVLKLSSLSWSSSQKPHGHPYPRILNKTERR